MSSRRLVLTLAAALAMSPLHEPAAAAQAYEHNQPSGPEGFSGTELIEPCRVSRRRFGLGQAAKASASSWA